MRLRDNLLVALTLAVFALAVGAPPAGADNSWQTSSNIWKAMDRCTRQARKQNPDHTAEANAKREAARQQCLRASNLPGEASSPPQSSAQH